MSLEQELRLHPVRDGSSRRRALQGVEADARSFGSLEDGSRGDPDVALAAIAGDAAAVTRIPEPLRSSAAFAAEAVRRNPRCLGLLPEGLRRDPAIVDAANKESPAGAAYQGEGLRLVGFCNKWKTTDSELRFKSRCNDAGKATHTLTVHLHNGCLSFQLVSCTAGFSFRLFPGAEPADGFFKLESGGDAMPATSGGEDDGHGRNFYIDERAGAVVTIQAEVPVGQAVGASVCCSLEGHAPVAAHAFREEAFPVSCILTQHGAQSLYQGSAPLPLPSLSQRPLEQKPFKPAAQEVKQRSIRLLPLPSAPQQRVILVNPEVEKKHEQLIDQARSLSKASFPRRFYSRELTGSTHLALVIDVAGETTFGYCLCCLERGTLVLEQLALKEGSLAPHVLRWAEGFAAQEGCDQVRIMEVNVVAAIDLGASGHLQLREAAQGGAGLRAAEGTPLCRFPEGTPAALEGERMVWPLRAVAKPAEWRAAAPCLPATKRAAADLFGLMARIRISTAGSFPHSQCMRTAHALRDELRKLGLEERLGRGTCKFVEGRFSATGGAKAQPHCYLRFGDGSIVDVTADQFGAFPQYWWPADPQHYF